VGCILLRCYDIVRTLRNLTHVALHTGHILLGITGFSTCITVVVSSAFDTGEWLITIFTRVPVLLAPYALRYVCSG